MTIEDIQKGRYSKGAIVYDNNNCHFGVVLDGRRGRDDDPCSLIMAFTSEGIIVHSPPNRALLPTGKVFNFKIFESIRGFILEE